MRVHGRTIRNGQKTNFGACYEAVKAYAQDLKGLLEEADMAQRKSFIKSFVKRIEIDGTNVVVRYKLPLPDSKKDHSDTVVLPIDTFGGAGGIRTLDLLTASQTFSQLNYSPTIVVYTLSNLAENDREGKT